MFRIKMFIFFIIIFDIFSIATINIAIANPIINHIAAGNASISKSSNTLTINQTTKKAIINWQSFNIAAPELTHFQQPKGGIALNRINPNNGASQIYGRLTATGKIILVNSAGIYFAPGSYVNVQGIIASTADISNQNFLSGNYVFDQSSTHNGAIVNKGNIIARENGLVALIGTGVSNEGLIQAKQGSVVLASGNKFTISLNGDQLINFAIDEGTNSVAVDATGQRLKNAVNNSGKILADGGTVLMKAHTARGIVDNAVNMSGVVQARSVSQENGVVILSAENSGNVEVSGSILVNGQSNHQGGKVKIVGKQIHLASSALINTSGDSGGGEIIIGGNDQGRGPEINAWVTTVDSGATLQADALTRGNGGKVIIWADNITQFHGNISARGGSINGDGGFIETSGKNQLFYENSKVDASAVHGKSGQWLLDPINLTITDSDAAIYSATLGNGTNVIIQTSGVGIDAGNITFDNTTIPISWSTTANLSAYADNDIIFNTPSIENINSSGSGNILLRADSDADSNGTVSFNASSPQIVSSSGNIDIFYNPSNYTTPNDYSTNVTLGTGTLTSYMLVNNATQLQDINTNLSGNYALGTNIDATALSFTFFPYYNGIFNGLDYAISNLTINDASSFANVGLFGLAFNASIKNLNLTNFSLTEIGDGNNIGGLAGYANNTIIDNVNISGVVNRDSSDAANYSTIGTLVGTLDSTSSLSNATSTAALSVDLGNATGFTEIGGLVGINNGGNIINSSYAGTVTVTASSDSVGFHVGGLAGSNNNGSIDQSGMVGPSSSGDLIVNSNINNTSEQIGGLLGVNYHPNASINHVISSMNVSVSGDNNGGSRQIGGLIGNNDGLMTNSSSSGTITVNSHLTSNLNGGANDAIGGLIGSNYNDDSVILQTVTSSSPIIVTGDSDGGVRYIGGLIGSNQSSLNNVSSSGSIDVTSTLQNIYLSGDYGQSANDSVGGLIGSNDNYSSAIYTFNNLSSSSNIYIHGDSFGSSRSIGGLIASNSNNSITDSTSSGDIFSDSTLNSIDLVGPLFPTQFAGENIGGLIGSNNNNAPYVFDALTSTSNITVTGDSNGGGRNIGGLIGSNQGSLTHASSNSQITIDSILSAIYLSGPNTINAYYAVGGLIGNNGNNNLFSIQNTTSSGSILVEGDSLGGNRNIGGLIGNNNQNAIFDSSNDRNVTINSKLQSIYLVGSFAQIASDSVGGLIGNNSNSLGINIANVTNYGNVSIEGDSDAGSRNIGGLIGNNSNSSLSDSKNEGDIYLTSNITAIYLVGDYAQNANDTVGGLIGSNNNNQSDSYQIQNTLNIGNLSIMGDNLGSNRNIGGLMGSSEGNMADAVNNGQINKIGSLFSTVSLAPHPNQSAFESIGGLIGNVYENSPTLFSLTNLTNTGDITFYAENINGLTNNGSSVTIGGLLGSNQSHIINANSAGAISITADLSTESRIQVGGFVGQNANYNSFGPATISDSSSATNITIDQVSSGLFNSAITVGGFVASNNGVINDSSTSSQIWVRVNLVGGRSDIGGFAGGNSPSNLPSYLNNVTQTGNLIVNGPNSTLNLPLPMLITNGGGQTIGGLIGINQASLDNSGISGVSNTGHIFVYSQAQGGVTQFIGGLVGQLQDSGQPSIIAHVQSGSVVNVNIDNDGSLAFIGGLVGFNLPLSTITGLVNTAAVNVSGTNTNTGLLMTGGVVGGDLSNLTQSYNTGPVNVSILNSSNGIVGVGGLAGGLLTLPPFIFGPLPTSTLTNSYNMGSVTVTGQNNGGTFSVGGLLGSVGSENSIVGPLNGGIIENTYSSGLVNSQVTGAVTVGGLVGNIIIDGYSSITNSFWDTDTSNMSQGVGSGSFPFVTGGCLHGNCTNGGVATLSHEATYTTGSPYIDGIGWDFNTIWGIFENISYPFLRVTFSTPHLISGTAYVDHGIVPLSAGKTIILAQNGNNVINVQTQKNGSYYAIIDDGVFISNTPLLAYLSNDAIQGNALAILPVSGNLTQFDIYGGTVFSEGSDNLSNTALGIAKGSLNTDILYTLSTNDLIINNGIHFLTSVTTPYILDGNITTSAGGSIHFKNTVSLSNDTTLNANNGNIIFDSNAALNGAYSLILNSMQTTTLGSVNGLTDLTIQGNGTTLINAANISTTGSQNYYNKITGLGTNGTVFTSTSGSIHLSNINNHFTTTNLAPISLNILSGINDATIFNTKNMVLGNMNVNSGNINITNSGNITMNGAVNTSNGSVTIMTNVGGIKLNSVINANASGDAIVLAGQYFINNVGSNALNPGAGRFLIWSQNPNNDKLNNIVYHFKQYNAIYNSTQILGTNNGVLYAIAPVITPNLVGTVKKVYDQTTSASLNVNNYSVSGVIDNDVVMLNYPTIGSYNNPNPGIHKNVFVSGIELNGVTNGNVIVYGYRLSSDSANANVGIITPSADASLSNPNSVADIIQQAIVNEEILTQKTDLFSIPDDLITINNTIDTLKNCKPNTHSTQKISIENICLAY